MRRYKAGIDYGERSSVENILLPTGSVTKPRRDHRRIKHYCVAPSLSGLESRETTPARYRGCGFFAGVVLIMIVANV